MQTDEEATRRRLGYIPGKKKCRPALASASINKPRPLGGAKSSGGPLPRASRPTTANRSTRASSRPASRSLLSKPAGRVVRDPPKDGTANRSTEASDDVASKQTRPLTRSMTVQKKTELPAPQPVRRKQPVREKVADPASKATATISKGPPAHLSPPPAVRPTAAVAASSPKPVKEAVAVSQKTEPVVPSKQPAVQTKPAVASAPPAQAASVNSTQPQKKGISQIQWSLKQFEIGKALGKGKFGNVYMARDKASKRVVALKVIYKKEIMAKNLVPQLQREIEIHNHLRHPNIIRLMGYFYDAQAVYIVLEFAKGGELYKLLQAQGRLPEAQAAKYVAEVASALRYCNEKGVIHRDIKPENLLLMEDGSVKLGDFGWAVQHHDTRRETLCGTLDYLPPEMVKEQAYGPEVDLWSLGVLAYELIVGYPCFETQSNEATFQKITTADLKFPSHVSAEAKEFISSLLNRDPTKRPSWAQISVHPWLKKDQ